jgi:hypothetical protein
MSTIFSCLANDSCLEYGQPKAPHFLGYLLDKKFGNGFHPIPGKTTTGFDVSWLRKDGSLASHPMHKVEESFVINPLIYQKNAIDDGKVNARIASDILYSFYETLERRVKIDMAAHMLARYLIEGYIKENTLRAEDLCTELRYREIDQGDLLVWFHNRGLPGCRFEAAKMRVMYHEFDPL